MNSTYLKWLRIGMGLFIIASLTFLCVAVGVKDNIMILTGFLLFALSLCCFLCSVYRIHEEIEPRENWRIISI